MSSLKNNNKNKNQYDICVDKRRLNGTKVSKKRLELILFGPKNGHYGSKFQYFRSQSIQLNYKSRICDTLN